jgi:hypothetical protein
VRSAAGGDTRAAGTAAVVGSDAAAVRAGKSGGSKGSTATS